MKRLFSRWILATAAAAALWGCGPKKAQVPEPALPPPTFTGPAFLHGTVGSLATLRGGEPLLVGGYGVVANLPGTGSSEVPAFLRQRMLNEARLRGWGSANLGGIAATTSPAAFLASPNTAVVTVEGLIPPGATKGTPFDVLVSALPQTQTTSLENGQLYTTTLGVGGTIPTVRFAREQAIASGPTYLNPFDLEAPEGQQFEMRRQVVVLSGGTVTNNRRLELILNQPSWYRSRIIADRINERFPKAPTDRQDTAVAKTDLIVELNVPARFAPDPRLLLDLVSHLYLQRSPNFEPEQAQRLGELLVQQPRYAPDIVLAWRALGKTAIPVIRRFAEQQDMTVRLAALEAMAGLSDEAAALALDKLARHPDAQVRRQVARILVNLPKSITGSRTLQDLVDDDDLEVRITAYETLAAIGDPAIQRQSMTEQGRLKFALDLVEADKPLIYISQVRWPRVVIFGKNTAFNWPLSASLWDGRLRLRGQSDQEPITVFYQGRNDVEGKVKTIAPTVANFVFLLAHSPNLNSPAEGFNLSYASVVNALFTLSRQGRLAGPIHLQHNPLATVVIQMRDQPMDQDLRPETGPEPVPSQRPASDTKGATALTGDRPDTLSP